MLQSVKTDQAAYPIDIYLLGAYAVMKETDALSQPIEEAGRFEGRERTSDVFHVAVNTVRKTSIWLTLI
jgi:hypothetical protein